MIDITQIKYPSLDKLIRVYPSMDILLNQDIHWTVKEDGSNIGIWYDGEKLRIRSRNQDDANEDVYKKFKECECYDNVFEFLKNCYDVHGDTHLVIFGELMAKGKSPTRIVTHEKTHFKVFDIWFDKLKKFMTRENVVFACKLHDIPYVECELVTKDTTIEDLIKTRDTMLELADKMQIEGFVGKVYFDKPFKSEPSKGKLNDDNYRFYFKEKPEHIKSHHDTKIEKPNITNLPMLNEGEIRASVRKVFDDFGFDDFKDIRKTMPRVVEYLKNECIKDNVKVYNTPRNPKKYYDELLEDILLNE